LCLYFILKKKSPFSEKLLFFFEKNFRILFYGQALMFGFLHLTNYNLDFNLFYLFPFVAISYIFIGFFLGYLRVRYSSGIFLCIFSHIVVNSLFYLLILR
jgi:membrane protease YdiL (CAAX protease family)